MIGGGAIRWVWGGAWVIGDPGSWVELAYDGLFTPVVYTERNLIGR
jgi:hypothetical protein